jgi:hypothetical protein
VLKALAVVFALVAASSMIAAIWGMVTGQETPRRGFLLRAGALLCFGIAVALGAAAH